MELHVTVNCLLAWLGWIIAIAGTAAAFWFGIPEIGTAALLFAGAAIWIDVRGRISECARKERAAYALGQESVRSIR